MGLSKAEEEKAVRDWATLMPCSKQIIALDPRESPDFELRFADSTTAGMEVTELAQQEQAAGTAQVRTLRTAIERALQARGLGAAVNLSFLANYGGVRLTRARHEHLVTRILSLVEEHLRNGGPAKRYSPKELSRWDVSPCDTVYVGASDHVQVLSGTHGRGLGHSFVQARISEKSAKVANYKANMPGSDQWLLLVSGVRLASGIWRAVMEDRVFPSAFDCVFCLDCYERAAFQLQTARM